MARKVYKEERKEWDRRYREKNREKRRAYDRQRLKDKREILVEKKRDYYSRNKDLIIARVIKYRLKNKEKVRIWQRTRRAREASVYSEKYTVQQVLDTYGTDCHICLKPINLKAPRQTGKKGWRHALHIDHLIPISKGGDDTLGNVRPAHAVCNLRKSARREDY